MAGKYWNYIKEAYQDVSIYDGPEAFGTAFRRLPPFIGDLLAAHWILSEVSNGGLLQFFLNATGVLAPEAAEGFDRMGLRQVAGLVREAMAFFGPKYPRESEEREEFVARQFGHSPDDEDWHPFEQNPFEDIDRRLYEVGTPNPGKIYDIMDLYSTGQVN